MATRFQLARGSAVLGAIARGPTGATGATGATGSLDFDDVDSASIVSADLLVFGDVSDSNATKKATLQSAVDVSILANGATFPNTGLHVLDSNASHDLIIAPGSDLSSDRTLTITTGDADRTLNISAANVTISSFMAGVLDDADEATFKASVNLEPGVDVQAYNANLTTWAGVAPSANGQSLVSAADYAAMRALLDLEAGTDFLSPAAIALAYQPLDGDLSAIAALTTTVAGLTSLTFADPGVDRILAWDDSAGAVAPIALADITAEGAPATGDYILIYGAEGDLRKVDWSDLPGAGGGISNVAEDATPQLGGDLDSNSYNIGFDDATGITDDSGNEQLIFQKTASAVNHVEITNAATGGDPTISAAGGDTDIDLVLAGKGTGVPKIGSNAIIDAGDTASESAAGIVELATDAETQTGTDTARAITPANLTARTATTSRTGIAELATDAEAQAQSDTGRVITPSNLAALASTTSMQGLVEKATDAEVRSAASGKGITADLIESASALVALTDAATVAVDWDAGINFSLTVTENRAIGNPTNGQPGTFRTILVQGNSTTDRTITFGANFLGEVPAITDCDSDRWYLLTIFCVTTSHFVVSSKKAKGS